MDKTWSSGFHGFSSRFPVLGGGTAQSRPGDGAFEKSRCLSLLWSAMGCDGGRRRPSGPSLAGVFEEALVGRVPGHWVSLGSPWHESLGVFSRVVCVRGVPCGVWMRCGGLFRYFPVSVVCVPGCQVEIVLVGWN